MDGLIRFSVGKDGELAIEFEEGLWEKVKAAAIAANEPPKRDNFFVILLKGNPNETAVKAVPPGEAPPCPPIAKIGMSV